MLRVTFHRLVVIGLWATLLLSTGARHWAVSAAVTPPRGELDFAACEVDDGDSCQAAEEVAPLVAKQPGVKATKIPLEISFPPAIALPGGSRATREIRITRACVGAPASEFGSRGPPAAV